MDANEDYLDSLLNSVMSQDSGGMDGSFGDTQQNSGSEAELEEINELLKKSDQNQMPDSDMLAMLEKAVSNLPDEISDNDVPDVFDIFSSESIDDGESAMPEYEAGIAGEAMQERRQKDGNSEAGGEAYLDALLNGTGSDAGTAISGQSEDEIVSLDSLQSEEEQLAMDDLSGGDDLLSLDSLQSEEEQPPMDDLSGGDDLLSLDSLQSEEEQLPMDDLSGGDDLLSLDSLQGEEEQPLTDDLSGGDDLLSLDSLQSEEEQPPTDDLSGGDDLLSLDSLQSDDLMSYGGLSEEETGSEPPTAEDDEIQREIDELLGLSGMSGEVQAPEEDSAAESSLSAENKVEADTSDSKKKKEKKEKKKLFGKKAKESANSAQSAADGTEDAGGESGGAFGDISNEDRMSEADMPQSAEEPGDALEGKNPKAKRKKEKAKKQKNTVTTEKEQKEPGFFGKLLNTLFEETDEEEDAQQEMDISDENREVIASVEGEKIENKKSGSKKAKKGKKGKAGAKQEAEGEDDEEAPVDEKKAAKDKKKKEKKEKKEQKEKARKEKEEEEKAVPKKKLPKGKVFSIFAFCLTLLAVIVILSFVLPQQLDLKKAREAYYDQDYLTVYQNLEGKDLSDSDYILYMRSKLILNMQGKLDNYLVYMGMDKEMAALNELMLAVHYYQFNRTLAEGYGALAEMDVIYTQVLSVLAQQYGVNEQEAIEIFALDDLSYNERLYYLVYGTEFVAPGVLQNGAAGQTGGTDMGSDGIGSGNTDMPDVLPEENETIGDSLFQEADGNGPDNTGTDVSDSEIMNDPFAQPTGGEEMGQPSNGEGGDQNSDDGVWDQAPDAADTNTPEGNRVPGESLSQGDGDVLYSGEVQNGNAVLQ